jgi:histidyl-tRNA synthetase
MSKKELSTESYRGVRDFYPEDMSIQNHIFNTWKKSVENFGFQQYDASILESADLYKAKSGEEIVNEQTYTFMDRGDREVTLRPEMTPTLARMIAKRQRELTYPLRWYSIPNLFRYEKPQRGRLREHFQLNVDMFGVEGLEAEIEMIAVAHKIMKDFGASEDLFKIYINNRKIVNELFDIYKLTDDQRHKTSKIIDKKAKISKSSFDIAIQEIIGKDSADFLNDINSPKSVVEKLGKDNEGVKEIITLIESLNKIGIKNVEFNPLLMRGFDYYTGTVFEIFDRSTENNRSLFGGGRFDEILGIFGKDPIPAIGFGMGDVTIRDFLQTHDLLPTVKASAHLYICNAGVDFIDLQKIASKIRSTRINVLVDISTKKIGDQIKKADKMGVPFVMCVGKDEIETGEFELKKLETGEKQKLSIEEIPVHVNPHSVHIKPKLIK